MTLKNRIAAAAACLFVVAASGQAQAAVLTINVAGIASFGSYGTVGNVFQTYNLGANSTVTGISYNVSLATAAGSGSWLSEMALDFGDSAGLDGVAFTPGFEDTFSGTGSYADSADLVSLGLSFAVGADGILALQFYETFNDVSGVDGTWTAGTISFVYTPTVVTAPVPEPETYALMLGGLGVVGWAAARRRRAA